MMDIPGLIKERQLDAMRSLGRKLGAGRERHIEVFNPFTQTVLGTVPKATLEEVRDQTGFDFHCPAVVPVTPRPDATRLAALRGPVAQQIADIYPAFAERVFGLAVAQ